MDPRLFQSKCKHLMIEYGDVLALLAEEVEREQFGLLNKGKDTFEVLKEVFRREGIKEGMNLLIRKIHQHGGKSGQAGQ